mmetsp:Transcript_32417/g.54375  ORF Transcript_32417/g.54375 Transcript_32417/m.54375 type:complete len:232 (-) Transcript_32417:150-845(-)
MGMTPELRGHALKAAGCRFSHKQMRCRRPFHTPGTPGEPSMCSPPTVHEAGKQRGGPPNRVWRAQGSLFGEHRGRNADRTGTTLLLQHTADKTHAAIVHTAVSGEGWCLLRDHPSLPAGSCLPNADSHRGYAMSRAGVAVLGLSARTSKALQTPQRINRHAHTPKYGPPGPAAKPLGTGVACGQGQKVSIARPAAEYTSVCGRDSDMARSVQMQNRGREGVPQGQDCARMT